MNHLLTRDSVVVFTLHESEFTGYMKGDCGNAVILSLRDFFL